MEKLRIKSDKDLITLYEQSDAFYAHYSICTRAYLVMQRHTEKSNEPFLLKTKSCFYENFSDTAN